MEENKSPNEELEQAQQEAEGEQENRKMQRCGYIGAVVIAVLIIFGIMWQASGKTISETWEEPESSKKTENAGKKDKNGKGEEETATDGAIRVVVEESLGEPVRIVSEAAVGAQAKRDELLAQQAVTAEAEEAARKQAEAEAADKAKAEAEAKARKEAEEKRAAQAQQEPESSAPESGGDSQGATDIPSTSKPVETVNFNGYVDEVIRLVNVERANAGLAPLAKNGAVCQAAEVRASEIGVSFSHTRPDGRNCFTVFEEFGISYTACGENIAAGHPTPEAVVQGWMNSPGHRANILNEDFEEIGVGVKNVNGSMQWVQLFLRVNW